MKTKKQKKDAPESFASPVCYAGSDELRPEFREEEERQDHAAHQTRQKKKS